MRRVALDRLEEEPPHHHHDSAPSTRTAPPATGARYSTIMKLAPGENGVAVPPEKPQLINDGQLAYASKFRARLSFPFCFWYSS